MAYEITMPQLGESVTEGQIVRWLKAPGERVRRFEAIVEVLTDKVTVEVPSPAEGVLAEIRVPEGETVPVGTVLAVLETADQKAPVPPAAHGSPAEGPAEAADGARSAASPARRGDAESGLYSPAVRRLAKEYGIDLKEVQGTGEGGRVTREDVLRHVERLQARSAGGLEPAVGAGAAATRPGQGAAEPGPAAGAGTPAPARQPVAQPGTDGETVTPTPVRAVIARRMVESWTTIPHAWTMVEADVTALVALREQVRDAFLRREGFELTFLPFAVYAAAQALRALPELNASWVDGRIVRHRRIHVGVAVGLEEALLVPVIRDADQLSVAGIARALHELIQGARSGRLGPDELQGGTFTVNNTGALGSVLSAPIINPPQAAILTTEAVSRRLVVLKDDQLAIRSIMNLCLSFDHRLIDGVHALRFLNAVKQRLEAFGPGSPLA